ncbi:MAG TPA: malto-oligosyltrehalose trehalohydrolase [Polyangiaceae bacterium]
MDPHALRHRGRTRRLPVGAETLGGGTHFRVWAPRRRAVELVLEGGRTEPLTFEDTGHFSVFAPEVVAGARYRFRLDGESELRPDPASRFQPLGPHGPSQVVDPSRFRWGDGRWSGVTLPGQVIYEMHVGTFTPEGTWAAATARLEKLVGVCSVVEMMPVADFAGDFGWGYDGVNLFAPTHLYGSPDDLRAFVDWAHALGLGVILDVVYNHLGPDGNYLGEFSKTYFTDRHETEWGDALNFDGEGNAGVREHYIANAGYWIDEFHFDGLRLDATQSIFDDSTPHVLAEVGSLVRATARGRGTIVVAESESQDTRLLRRREDGGFGLDAAWNDDFHHSALVALTGRSEAYFSDHRGTPQELLSATKHGYLFQGQHYAWQNKRRGSSTRGIAPSRFVTYLENHDQVANSARGERPRASAHPGRLRALTALVLLGPGTPMLFQGQEFGSTSPFLYFAHHDGELAAAVRKGRAEFLSQFPSIAQEEVRSRLDDPADRATFLRCKLDWSERERHAPILAMHADLFALRRSDETIQSQGIRGLDGAVLGAHAFVIRYAGAVEMDDRLVVVNLGPDRSFESIAEPLLAPPAGAVWSLLWSSEDVRYGGDGTPPPETSKGWRLRGETTMLLAPRLEAK